MSLRFEKPIIYLITKGEATDANFAEARREILDIVRVAVEEKISFIQIREKRLSPRPLFELTAAAVRITCNSATHLLVNEYAGIALAANADGVHLPANSLPADVIRKNLPKDFIIGVSTHSLESASTAATDGADFVVFGPIFESPGKCECHGLAALSDVCEKLRPFPVIGLGGIDESNCESVMASGASGIAAIRVLNDPESLRSIARRLRG